MVGLDFLGLVNYIGPDLWSLLHALRAPKHVCGRLTREQVPLHTENIMRYYSDKNGTLSPMIGITVQAL